MIQANETDLGERHLYCDGKAKLLFTENETNAKQLFGGENRTPFVKDGINNYLVHDQTKAVNPKQTGTKAAAHYRVTVPAGQCEIIRLRLSDVAPANLAASYGTGRQRLRQSFR